MNGAPVPGDAATTTAQDTTQVTIEDYAADLSVAARDSGQARARIADPDAFDGAIAAVREALDRYGVITADDVLASRGPETGAAFSHLRRLGEIEVCGYAVSRRHAAHGRLIRAWRRSP